MSASIGPHGLVRHIVVTGRTADGKTTLFVEARLFAKVVGHADKLGRTSDSHESYNQRCDQLAVAAITAG